MYGKCEDTISTMHSTGTSRTSTWRAMYYYYSAKRLSIVPLSFCLTPYTCMGSFATPAVIASACFWLILLLLYSCSSRSFFFRFHYISAVVRRASQVATAKGCLVPLQPFLGYQSRKGIPEWWLLRFLRHLSGYRYDEAREVCNCYITNRFDVTFAHQKGHLMEREFTVLYMPAVCTEDGREAQIESKGYRNSIVLNKWVMIHAFYSREHVALRSGKQWQRVQGYAVPEGMSWESKERGIIEFI